MAIDAKLAQALDQATGEVRRAFLWFGSFAVYLVTTVAATTHEQLLKGTLLRLPLLGVDLPIVGFYLIAPVVFLLLHGNLLFQLHLLGRCVRSVPPSERQPEGQPGAGPTFIVTQYLMGGLGGFRLLLAPAVWLTVLVFPVAALTFVQIRFLPYHSEAITAAHRALVLADVAMALGLWTLTIHDLGVSSRRGWVARLGRIAPAALLRRLVGTAGYALLVAIGVAMVMFSLRIAVISDEHIELREDAGYVLMDPVDRRLEGISPCDHDPAVIRPLRQDAAAPPLAEAVCAWGDGPLAWLRPVTPPVRFAAAPQQTMPCLTYLMFEAPTTPLDMRRNLIARGVDFRGTGTQSQAYGGGFDLRGRDLRFADFTGARLDRADLRGANLFGAVLARASLEAADLGDIARTEFDRCEFLTFDGGGRAFCRTFARQSSLEGARLVRARLTKADLQRADLRHADLTGAELSEADLEGAWLGEADLADAVLNGAWLDRAQLAEARLVGANLNCARAREADFRAADLSGVAAGRARLNGASLREARLVASYLGRADLTCADLAGAYLAGVDLRGARLTGVDWGGAEAASTAAGPPACPPVGPGAPAALHLVDLRAAVTDPAAGARIAGAAAQPGTMLLVDGAPEAPLPPEHDREMLKLLTDAAATGGMLQPWLLNRIEREWQDGCSVRPYQSELAARLLEGACEAGKRFAPRDWWLLQLARRYPDPAVAQRDARCVAGPPPAPTGCTAPPWRPVDTPP